MGKKDSEQDKKGGLYSEGRPLIIKAGDTQIKITPTITIQGEESEDEPQSPNAPIITNISDGQVFIGTKIDISGTIKQNP
jgi:hypothetical protein